MKKENFVSMILGVIGTILFAIGMCMTMISEWNAFQEGVTAGVCGLCVLVLMFIVRKKMQGKAIVNVNIKTVGIALFGIMGTMVLGIGMCMSMVWQGLLIQGIILGLIGIVLLICLIPLCKGIKQKGGI